MKRIGTKKIRGARARRPLFAAPRRKVFQRRFAQGVLCEAPNTASEALALPKH